MQMLLINSFGHAQNHDKLELKLQLWTKEILKNWIHLVIGDV